MTARPDSALPSATVRLRAAIYARVSSQAQKDHQTIQNQLRVLPEYAAAQGWEVVGVYTDDGKSAKSGVLDARDGFARLLKDAEARKFDVLLVVDIDRLTRSDDMMERAQILGPFQRLGIDIVTPAGGRLDMRSMLGEVWATFQAIAAAEWLKKHRERIKAGKVRAIAQGKKPAGPTPYGLGYDRWDGRWWIESEAAEVIREIFRRVIAREASETIAADFRDRGILRPRGGAWLRERVWQIVRSRVYVGEFTVDKRRGQVIRVPAIVDEATWEAAQAVLASHHRRGLRRTKHTYLLEELAVCCRCGSRIGISSGSRVNGTVSRYVCSHRRRPPPGSPACELAPVKTASADERLWRSLREILDRPEILETALGWNRGAAEDAPAWERDLEQAEKRLQKLTASEADAIARHRRGQLSAGGVDAALNGIKSERTMMERQAKTARRALTSRQVAAARIDDLQEALFVARAQLDTASPEARRHVIRAMFAPGSIVVGDPEIVATLRLTLRSHGEGASTSNAPEATLEIRLVA